MESSEENVGHVAKLLTSEEFEKMKAQDSRLVSERCAILLEKEAKKHWDLFYKRNTTNFFKDRHWTTREFQELLDVGSIDNGCLIEVGCGVGNLIYPLLEDGLRFKKIYACDLSPRAVNFIKEHKLFDPKIMTAFQADVTTDDCFSDIHDSIDVATLIFVLSAIHPQKFQSQESF
uniref:Mettl6_0 protein n=1 Tax=Fopius arisanus TaxID=64838 RepID=A0A0C9R973_9HYME